MGNYLITGGAGFFGTILKKKFLENGYKCISIDLIKDDFVHENFEAIQGDIRNKELVEEIFKNNKFDAVFHCAALLAHEVKNKNELWTSNVDGTEIVADMAIKYNVKKLMFISSNCLWGQSFDNLVTEEEEPNPIEIYGESKLECEKILLARKDK